jgi:hypothetical protein
MTEKYTQENIFILVGESQQVCNHRSMKDIYEDIIRDKTIQNFKNKVKQLSTTMSNGG